MNSKSQPLRLAVISLSLLCFVFIAWIIHEANIARDNALFQLVRSIPYGDKFGHFGVAFALTIAADLLLRGRALKLGRHSLPIGSLIVLALAVGEEASQAFMPTRTFDLYDLLAGILGIAAATAAIRATRRKPKTKSSVFKT